MKFLSFDYEKSGNCIIQHLKGSDIQYNGLFKNDFDLTALDIFELKDNGINIFYDFITTDKI